MTKHSLLPLLFGILLLLTLLFIYPKVCYYSAYAAEYDTDTVASVQNALNNAGYDCGAADGIAGSKTQEIIQQYQEENGLPVTGEIDEGLLSSLGIQNTSIIEEYGNLIFDKLCDENSKIIAGDPTIEDDHYLRTIFYDSSFVASVFLEQLESQHALFVMVDESYNENYLDDYEVLLANLIESMEQNVSAYEAMTIVVQSIGNLGEYYDYNDNLYSMDGTYFSALINDPVIESDEADEVELETGALETGTAESGEELVTSDGIIEIARLNGSYAKEFSDGLAAVQIGDLWGYINTEGEFEIEPKYSDAFSFSDGRARVTFDGSDMCIDTSGKVVIGAEWDGAYREFSEGLLGVKKDDKWGFVDVDDNIVIEPQFDYARYFSYGLSPVEINNKWGFIDMDGNMVFEIESELDYAGNFQENGLATIKLEENDKIGYIDREGNIVIEPQFDQITGDFSEGLCAAKVNDKWGYIDETGEWVIKPQYEFANNFSNGLARVNDGIETFFINKDGDVVQIPGEINHSFVQGISISADGVVDVDGNLLIPIENATDMTGITDGLVIIMTGEELIIYDVSGVITE